MQPVAHCRGTETAGSIVLLGKASLGVAVLPCGIETGSGHTGGD